MIVTAPAKINLTLEILGRRADGFHEVKTVLQTIDLQDQLEIETAPALTVECDDPSLSGETNLVWRAASGLAAHAGTEPGARVFLRKSIPVGMGLGGGSSDAAAALLSLNELWGLGLNVDELAGLAAGIGSDVAFFLWGGTALASGRGEIIEPAPSVPPILLTLVCPTETIPEKTRKVYSQVTPGQYSDGARTGEFLEILRAGQFVSDMVSNGLDEVCFRVFPGLDELRHQLADLAASKPVVSGAGPAMFCLPTNEDEHQSIANTLKPQGFQVYRVRTVGPKTREAGQYRAGGP